MNIKHYYTDDFTRYDSLVSTAIEKISMDNFEPISCIGKGA